jgi:hypothetical protein
VKYVLSERDAEQLRYLMQKVPAGELTVEVSPLQLLGECRRLRFTVSNTGVVMSMDLGEEVKT